MDQTLLYSIIIPAYNEAEHLPECLARLREAMASCPSPGEVIVTDNNSTDRTAELAQSAGARVVFEAHRQISLARNRGAATAGGRYLIFIDADTIVSPELLRLTLDEMISGRSCCGGARIAFDGRIPMLARGMMACWNLMAPIMGWAAGCYFFMTADVFREAGGFNEKLYAAEEVDLSRRLARIARTRRQRFTVITAAPVVTSARKLHVHSMWKILAVFVILGIFPVLLKNRKWCFFWYRCREDRQ